MRPHTESMPVISIVIPNYNQEHYVEACIQSIQKQTFTDFEAIIIDDGSTDTSLDVIHHAIAQDDRFTVITQQNQGVGMARNAGLQRATGTWICFIDPDDTILPDYLQTLLDTAHTYPHADVIMSTCVAISDTQRSRQHFFPNDVVAHTQAEKKPFYQQLMDGGFAQPKEFVTAIGVPWGKLYRHSFLQEHALQFDPELPRMQDNLFNMQVFQEAHELVYIDYAGYEYRIDNLIARTYTKAVAKQYYPAIDARADFMRHYQLITDPELYAAWNEEQVNLYFQEIKAVALLAPHNLRAMRTAVHGRIRELHDRIQQIDASALSRNARLKLSMLRGTVTLEPMIAVWFAQQQH